MLPCYSDCKPLSSVNVIGAGPGRLLVIWLSDYHSKTACAIAMSRLLLQIEHFFRKKKQFIAR